MTSDPPDLSPDEFIARRADLIAAGQLLCGEEWMSPLARLLGPHHPKGKRDTIHPGDVRRWAAGTRPVPVWALRVLVELCANRAAARREEIERLQAVAGRLARLADSAEE